MKTYDKFYCIPNQQRIVGKGDKYVFENSCQ